MITNAHSCALLGMELGKRTFTLADNHYIGLSTTALTTDGTNYTEPSASSGYTRAVVPNTEEYWSAPANFSVRNAQRIAFNFTDGAGTDIATHWFITTSETGGVAIYYGELNIPRNMPQNSQIWVDVGELILERVNPS